MGAIIATMEDNDSTACTRCKAPTMYHMMYWLNDAHGIPLCKVCPSCEAQARKKYNPAIFRHYTSYDLDAGEQIEPDY